jgi:hypothetical protein
VPQTMRADDWLAALPAAAGWNHIGHRATGLLPAPQQAEVGSALTRVSSNLRPGGW